MINHAQIGNWYRWLIPDHFFCQSYFVWIINLNGLPKIKLEIFDSMMDSSIEIRQKLLTLIWHCDVYWNSWHCKLLGSEFWNSFLLLVICWSLIFWLMRLIAWQLAQFLLLLPNRCLGVLSFDIHILHGAIEFILHVILLDPLLLWNAWKLRCLILWRWCVAAHTNIGWVHIWAGSWCVWSLIQKQICDWVRLGLGSWSWCRSTWWFFLLIKGWENTVISSCSGGFTRWSSWCSWSRGFLS